MNDLRVFVFSPAFGLPTSGPFALKLEMWLRMHDISYERVYENNPQKGPKGKNPWVEIDGELMGDTKLIIERLAEERGIDLDAGLTAEQVATGTAVARMLEEHLHQVLEYELFINDNGYAYMEEMFSDEFPWGIGWLIRSAMRRHFKKHLYQRGIARHSAEIVAQMGREDLDAVETLLPEQGYLFGDRPSRFDASIFGLTAPLVRSPIDAPVMNYASTLPRLSTFCDRVMQTYFDEDAEGPRMAA
jgi:glutathione S-transferase